MLIFVAINSLLKMEYNNLIKLVGVFSDEITIMRDDKTQGTYVGYTYNNDIINILPHSLINYKIKEQFAKYIILIDGVLYTMVLNEYGILNDISTENKNISNKYYHFKDRLNSIGMCYSDLFRVEKRVSSSILYMPYDIKVYKQKGSKIYDEIKLYRYYDSISHYNDEVLYHIEDETFFKRYLGTTHNINLHKIYKIYNNISTKILISVLDSGIFKLKSFDTWSNKKEITDTIKNNIFIIKLYHRVGKLREFILSQTYNNFLLTNIIYYLIDNDNELANQLLKKYSISDEYNRENSYIIMNGLVNIKYRAFYHINGLDNFMLDNYSIFNNIQQTKLLKILERYGRLFIEDGETNLILDKYVLDAGLKLTVPQLLLFRKVHGDIIKGRIIKIIDEKNILASLKSISMKSPYLLKKILKDSYIQKLLNHDIIYEIVSLTCNYYDYLPSVYEDQIKEFIKEYLIVILKYITLEEYMDIYRGRNYTFFNHLNRNVCSGFKLDEYFKILKIILC